MSIISNADWTAHLAELAARTKAEYAAFLARVAVPMTDEEANSITDDGPPCQMWSREREYRADCKRADELAKGEGSWLV